MSAERQDIALPLQPNGQRRTRNRRAPVTLQNGLPPAPRVRRIHDAASVAAELTSLYREMRKGRLDTVEGCRLAHVLHLAGRILAELDTAREVKRLREELERVQGAPGAPTLTALPLPEELREVPSAPVGEEGA